MEAVILVAKNTSGVFFYRLFFGRFFEVVLSFSLRFFLDRFFNRFLPYFQRFLNVCLPFFTFFLGPAASGRHRDPFGTHFCLLCKGKLPLRGAPGRSHVCGPFFYRCLCFRIVCYRFCIVCHSCLTVRLPFCVAIFPLPVFFFSCFS